MRWLAGSARLSRAWLLRAPPLGSRALCSGSKTIVQKVEETGGDVEVAAPLKNAKGEVCVHSSVGMQQYA